MEGFILFLVVVFLIIVIVNWIVTVAIPWFIFNVMPVIGIIVAGIFAVILMITLVLAFLEMVKIAALVIKTRRHAPPVIFEGEARIAYLLGPVWDDILSFYKDTSVRIRKRIADSATKSEVASSWYEKVYHSANVVFFATFGMLGVLIAAVLVGVVIGVFASSYWIWFGSLWVVDRAYLFLRGVFSYCPECNHKSYHLFYDCPSCSMVPAVRHKHLLPNRAGALFHTCVCGQKVPSHFLTGRGREMNAYCTLHEHPVNERLVGTKTTHVALAGAPDSGKTTLMVEILGVLLSGKEKLSGVNFELEDDTQRKEVSHWISNLNAGRYPLKTDVQRHRATTVVYLGENAERRSLYLFDAAGEVFSENAEKRKTHTYFDSQDFVVLVVDPLSISSFRERAEARIGRAAVLAAQPSAAKPTDVLAGLIELLERVDAPARKGRFLARLKIIVTKSDVAGLAGVLDSQGGGVEGWLVAQGESGFLTMVHSNFGSVSFSHAGRDPAHSKASNVSRLAKQLVFEALPSKTIPTTLSEERHS